MKRPKLEQIATVRRQVRYLASLTHVQACLCCADDLAIANENADAPYAPALILRVQRRCELALRPETERAELIARRLAFSSATT